MTDLETAVWSFGRHLLKDALDHPEAPADRYLLENACHLAACLQHARFNILREGEPVDYFAVSYCMNLHDLALMIDELGGEQHPALFALVWTFERLWPVENSLVAGLSAPEPEIA